jgi:hypothetical protein
LVALTRRQVSAASSVRYTPPAPACSTVATSTSGREAAIATPMRPLSPAGSPLSSFRQLVPPSMDFHSALPGPPPLKPKGLRSRW